MNCDGPEIIKFMPMFNLKVYNPDYSAKKNPETDLSSGLTVFVSWPHLAKEIGNSSMISLYKNEIVKGIVVCEDGVYVRLSNVYDSK